MRTESRMNSWLCIQEISAWGIRRLAWLKEQTAKLHNVRFLPFQPLEKLHLSLRAADVHIVSMQEDLCGLLVPSKAYGGVAAGRPCIFMGPAESEAAQFIREKGCGVVLPARDGMALAGCLQRLADHPGELERLQQQAEAAAPELTVMHAVQTFWKALEDLDDTKK
jgi:colanic acid biosynthesis glycosyl transferase WcaI